jgi:hypothetical protein
MNKIESSNTQTITETRSYVQGYIYRVPKNHDVLVQLNKIVVPWFEKQDGRMDLFQLNKSETIEGVESVAETLSILEDEEELWIERDRKHLEDAFSKMLQDESVDPLSNTLWLYSHKERAR